VSEGARERILAAAVRRIAVDGIDAVRIARIAMDAGVSTALVHYHFATREALLAEALEFSFAQAGDERTHGGHGRLREMIEQCLPLPGEQETQWVLWVELWLRAVRVPELRPFAAEQYRRMRAWLTDAIEEGVQRGEFSTQDPGEVADRVLALIDGYGVRALLGDPAMPVERVREEIWAVLTRDLGLEQGEEEVARASQGIGYEPAPAAGPVGADGGRPHRGGGARRL
jgi:AcrR family transcriptional regulator